MVDRILHFLGDPRSEGGYSPKAMRRFLVRAFGGAERRAEMKKCDLKEYSALMESGRCYEALEIIEKCKLLKHGLTAQKVFEDLLRHGGLENAAGWAREHGLEEELKLAAKKKLRQCCPRCDLCTIHEYGLEDELVAPLRSFINAALSGVRPGSQLYYKSYEYRRYYSEDRLFGEADMKHDLLRASALARKKNVTEELCQLGKLMFERMMEKGQFYDAITIAQDFGFGREALAALDKGVDELIAVRKYGEVASISIHFAAKGCSIAAKIFLNAIKGLEPADRVEGMVCAGRLFANSHAFTHALKMYAEALKLVRESNPERASEILTELGRAWESAAAHSMDKREQAEFYGYAATAYVGAGDLIEKTDLEKAVEMYDIACVVASKRSCAA